MEPAVSLQRRVAALLAKRPVDWRPAPGGYTAAERWVVRFAEGSSCFVKAATNELTAAWLRDEYAKVYSRIEAPFLPRLLAWEDDGATPLLLLEDLSDARWPPPWTDDAVRAVLRGLEALHATRIEGLIAVTDVVQMDAGAWDAGGSTWQSVKDDPAPFLSLGLCSWRWLDAALPALLDASRLSLLLGDDACHFDVRSDNICIAGERAVFVDWNWASIGNGAADVAFWLPSLEAEGGPAPEAILPDQPGLAALVSGFFGARAGLEAVAEAPRVREVQRTQLRPALAWAVRALGLPPLDVLPTN